ncbi:MAG: NUDIX domain-containing protein [Kineosporiaceae bacterium]
MTDEVVALYDPDDVAGRVVGSALRSRVRAENLPHAATGVLVRRPTGEVLVHRRADSKDLWPGGHDCAAGGVVLAGETPDEAARRELAEELGVEGVPLTPLLTSWYRDDRTHYLAHVYTAVWDGDVRFDDGEVAAGWWEAPEVLAARLADPGWAFVPDTRRLLDLVGLGPHGALGPAAGTSGACAGREPWEPGDVVVYRFGVSGRTRWARLARVVEDGPDGLVLWVAAGSTTVEQSLADGRPVREAPLAERFDVPRVRRTGRWRSPGVVMLVPPAGQAWSVWWFFEPDGSFRGWYGNLEAPHVLRTTLHGSHLVDTSDRALDVEVTRERVPTWKDEDEFAVLTGRPGRWADRQVDGIRADGEHLMDLARRGAPPFDGRWTTFSPDPAWSLPSFPPDWDLPHLAGP